MKNNHNELRFFNDVPEEITSFILKHNNICLTIRKKNGMNILSNQACLDMKYQCFHDNGEVNTSETAVPVSDLSVFDDIVKAASQGLDFLIVKLKSFDHGGAMVIAILMQSDLAINLEDMNSQQEKTEQTRCVIF